VITRCFLVAVMISATLVSSARSAFAQPTEAENERLENVGIVLKEIFGMPDAIPQDLLDKAECVIVFPSVKKLALGVGGSYGRGVISCRTGATYDGPWSAPALFALEGASVGFQLGAQATDFILLVMNDRGASSVLGSKVKLGADASAAAGPKGRNAAASTDIVMQAEILSYSRARGLFAGVSLEGSTLRADNDANERLYGRKIEAREVVKGGMPIPSGLKSFVDLLNKKSPKNLSDRPK
jgi:SH3 domain-containing YSC84-like protein 1